MSEKHVRIPKEYFDYFENLYSENQDVRIAIDIIVDNIVGGGFDIVSSGEGQEEMIQELKEFSKRIKLPRLNFRIAQDMLVFGNAFYELVFKEGEGIVDVKCHHPKTIGVVTDSKGKIKGYVKVEGDKVVKHFKVKEIAHFANEPREGPYGRSQIELLVPVLKKEINLGDIPSF